MKPIDTGATPQSLRASCKYAACYCEENVYFLCQQLLQSGLCSPQHLYVVFITNQRRQTPIWYQKAGHGTDGFVLWDYHVILVELPHDELGAARVWDLDTLLPYPCDMSAYIEYGLQIGHLTMQGPYERRYRIVPSADYLQHFCSDRRHMNRPDGSWSASPPPWPCIRPPGMADPAPALTEAREAATYPTAAPRAAGADLSVSGKGGDLLVLEGHNLDTYLDVSVCCSCYRDATEGQSTRPEGRDRSQTTDPELQGSSCQFHEQGKVGQQQQQQLGQDLLQACLCEPLGIVLEEEEAMAVFAPRAAGATNEQGGAGIIRQKAAAGGS